MQKLCNILSVIHKILKMTVSAENLSYQFNNYKM